MVDRLEANMQEFLDNQLSLLPRQLRIAQIVDQTALQNGLQQSQKELFEQTFRPVEGKMKRDVEEMKKAAEAKVAEIRRAETAGLQELEGLKGQIQAQMDNQERLVGEIARVVEEKSTALATSHHQARTDIYEMRQTVAGLKQSTETLSTLIQKKQIKAEIKGEIDNPGGDRVKFQVLNKKMYCLDHSVLRLFNSYDQSVYWSQEIVPVIPGHAQLEVSALLPEDFPPNVDYDVAIWMNGKVISNSVQYRT